MEKRLDDVVSLELQQYPKETSILVKFHGDADGYGRVSVPISLDEALQLARDICTLTSEAVNG